MQQFRADSDIDLCRNVLIAELALVACNMQFALPNRTTIPATREAGLVQIAKSLIYQRVGALVCIVACPSIWFRAMLIFGSQFSP